MSHLEERRARAAARRKALRRYQAFHPRRQARCERCKRPTGGGTRCYWHRNV